MKNDIEICKKVCLIKPHIFKSIPMYLQTNLQFIKSVIVINPYIYCFISKNLKNNKNFISYIYEKNKKITKYLSEKLREELKAKENLKILKDFNKVFEGYDIYGIIESYLY